MVADKPNDNLYIRYQGVRVSEKMAPPLARLMALRDPEISIDYIESETHPTL